MERKEAAILRTVLYADVFDFPLTIDEIHRYLISDSAIGKVDIRATLQASPKLNKLLHSGEGYFCLKDRDHLIGVRQERERTTQSLWQAATKYGRWLSYIPFVRMVALTGALAVRNPSSMDDDFDYLLITQPKRVWLARAFAILIVRVVRLLGYEICPNYVLASDQLTQSRQDLYMAHEVAQMQPIYGHKLYYEMLEQNPWVQYYLPNAIAYPMAVDKPSRIQKFTEWLLSGAVGDRLEQWEYRRKVKKFRPQMEKETSSAEIDESSVKGHFEDHGMPVMLRYEELLRDYGLYKKAQALAGD